MDQVDVKAPRSPDDPRPLMLDMKFTVRAWEEYVNRLAAEAGIPGSYRPIVTFLAHHPGANQRMIAEHNRVTSAAVSQTVRDMINEGYIYRESDSDDLRASRLFLAEKGLVVDGKLRSKVGDAERAISSALSPEQLAEFTNTLHLIYGVIKERSV